MNKINAPRRITWRIIGIVALGMLGGACVLSILYWDIPEGYWEENPVWSPDGRYIAFECYHGKPDFEGFYPQSGYEICVSSSDGTGYRQLTTNDRADRYPTWSPDGKRIAFASSGFTEKTFTDRIMLIDSDGSNLIELAVGRESTSWSPDGQYVAYTDVKGNLASVNVETGESIQLTGPRDQGYDFRPVWSPDGQRIAFTSNRDDHEEVYIVNANGTGETRLTSGDTHSNSPTWSPDGKYIAFLSLKDFKPATGTGYWALEIIKPDGSNRTKLTSRYTDAMVWTSDGRGIIFESNGEVFKINLDSGAETQLTGFPTDGGLRLSPDGKRVATVRKESPGSSYTERIWIINTDSSKEIKLTQK